MVELPYGVGTEKIIEAITDEVKGKLITSGPRKGQRRPPGCRASPTSRTSPTASTAPGWSIECKVGVNPQALLADLYRLTPLEQSFGINNLVLVDGQPQTLGLKALLEVFLAHRYEVVTRRTTLPAHQAAGPAAPGRRPADRADRHRPGGRADPGQRRRGRRPRTALMSRVRAVRHPGHLHPGHPAAPAHPFDRIELETEQERLRAEIAELSRILDDEDVLKKVVSDELAAVASASSATERRTTLIDGDLKEVLAASAPAGPLEVADDPCQVILSATGLIARTAAESRGGHRGRAAATAGSSTTRYARWCTPPPAAGCCW